MKSAQEWFDAYGASHQDPTNKVIHWFCVPAIAFTTVVLLAALPHDLLHGAVPSSLRAYAHWGTVLVMLSLIFYLRMSWTIGLGMAAFSALTLWGTAMLASWQAAGGPPMWMVGVIVFSVAWFFQFVGHKIEGQKPSFFEDLQFLLVGPAWLLQFAYRRAGIPI